MKRLILSILLFSSLVSDGQVITLLANSRHPVAYQVPPPTPYTPRPMSYTGYSDTMYSFGDSRTDPAFTVSGVSYNYVERFVDTLGIKIANHGSSGQGVSWMIQKLYDHADTARSNNPMLVWVGYNNVRYIGYSNRLMNKLKNGYLAVLANQFCDTMEYGGNLTTAGLWNNLGHSIGVHFKSYYASGGQRKGAYTTYTYAANGSQLSWSFNGTAVVVGAVGQDTVNKQSYEAVLGRWVVLIDDVVKDTILPYEQTEGLRPNYEADQTYFTMIKIYPGLSSGAHTLKLRPIDAGKPHFMDWVGTLRAPAQVPPVVFMKEMYQSAAGYVSDPTFDAGTNAYMDSASAAMLWSMNEFVDVDTAYQQKMTLLNPNSVIDTNGTTHFVPDLIHLNNPGNDSVARYLRRWISFTAASLPRVASIDFRASGTSSGVTNMNTAAGDPVVLDSIVIANLIDSTGASTGWRFVAKKVNWSGYSGAAANNAISGITAGSALSPGFALQSYQSGWYQYYGGTNNSSLYDNTKPQFEITGLDPAKTYEITFAGSDGTYGFDNSPTRFRVEGATQPAYQDLNGDVTNVTTNVKIQVQPDSGGKIKGWVNAVFQSSELSLICGLTIRQL
ncbi:MAG: hypothetical protein B7Z54_02400 [Sphingobacteriales bacterium 12-47-4]|nr:MAG: hypothetical protein B7Z54_02400 [Sphingobacteriales bacterium 12-47-4]